VTRARFCAPRSATVDASGRHLSPPERTGFLSVLRHFGASGSPEEVNIRSTLISTFAELGTSSSVVDALAARSIIEPFPIQEMVISDALDGHDLLVQSPTGSGKTLAFGVPLVDILEPGGFGPGALILAPTRELASQIVDELEVLARARKLRVAAVYGGVGFGPQIAAAKKADILVATPGRLEDLIARGAVHLDQVQVPILREAQQLHNVSERLDTLGDHTGVSEALITISGNVRHTATLPEVLVLTKIGSVSEPGPPNT